MYNTLPVAYDSDDAILSTRDCDGMTQAWKWCVPTVTGCGRVWVDVRGCIFFLEKELLFLSIS